MSIGAFASAPPRLARQRCGGACLWVAASAATAVLVLVPIVSLAAIAAGGFGDAWGHLALNVLPVATLNTALLLLGVGVVAIAIGTGAAWLVTAYDSPAGASSTGRCSAARGPHHIVAYAYLDLLHPIGPSDSSARSSASPRTTSTCLT
jgi:iron(III) transport system permease protein